MPINVVNVEQPEQIVHPEETSTSKEHNSEELNSAIEPKVSFYKQLFNTCKEKMGPLKKAAKAAAFFVVTSGAVQEAQAQNSLPNLESLAQKQNMRSIVKDTYESHVSKNKDTTYRIRESSSDQKVTSKENWEEKPVEFSKNIEGSSFVLPQEEDTIIYKNVDVKTFTVSGQSRDDKYFSEETEDSESFKFFEAVRVQDTTSSTEIETKNTMIGIDETKEEAIISALSHASSLWKSEIQAQTLQYVKNEMSGHSSKSALLFNQLATDESNNHFDVVKVVVKKVTMQGKDMYQATVLY